VGVGSGVAEQAASTNAIPATENTVLRSGNTSSLSLTSQFIGRRKDYFAAAAFTEKASAAAWKTRPAWGSVSSNDRCINPDVERFGYKRGGVNSIEIPSSHLVMLSHPKEVADLIRTAIAGS
jgi:hypothetical protein